MDIDVLIALIMVLFVLGQAFLFIHPNNFTSNWNLQHHGQQQPHEIHSIDASLRYSHWIRDKELSLVAESENITKEELWKLDAILRRISFRNKTIILTTVNEAWAAPDSLIDVFLESFNVGNGTQNLLQHLLIVAFDQKAFDRCQTVHKHCFRYYSGVESLSDEKMFMTEGYVKLVWKRIDLMRLVLTMGYNLIFSDADILWLRDPFPHIPKTADVAFSRDFPKHKKANTGFLYLRASNKTLQLFELWMGHRRLYPLLHDQDVMNIIMSKRRKELAVLGIDIRFLSTDMISGFCFLSRDIQSICTVHANCCTSIHRKIDDLRVVIERWKYYMTSLDDKLRDNISWGVPKECKKSWI